MPFPRLVLPQAAALRIGRYFARVIVEASKAGTIAATNRMRVEMQGETRRALGPRMSRTWARPRFYLQPKSNQQAVMTAGLFGSKAANIIRANLRSGTLHPRIRQSMAIPLPAAGKRGAGRFNSTKLTPLTYEAAYSVKLIPVKLPNGSLVLVDPEFRAVTSRVTPGVQTFKPATAAQRKKAGPRARARFVSMPVFLLVTQVRHKKTIDLNHVWNRVALTFTEHFAAKVSEARVEFQQLPRDGGEDPLK